MIDYLQWDPLALRMGLKLSPIPCGRGGGGQKMKNGCFYFTFHSSAFWNIVIGGGLVSKLVWPKPSKIYPDVLLVWPAVTIWRNVGVALAKSVWHWPHRPYGILHQGISWYSDFTVQLHFSYEVFFYETWLDFGNNFYLLESFEEMVKFSHLEIYDTGIAPNALGEQYACRYAGKMSTMKLRDAH